MRAIREIAGGLFLALITTCTVIGGLLLAFRETGLALVSGTPLVEVTTAAPASATRTIILPTRTTVDPATRPASPTHTATLRGADTATPAPTDTHTPPPAPTQTPPATQTPRPTPAFTATLGPATQPTQPPTVCGPPANWVQYRVKPGDTLFQLSLTFGVSTPALRTANCLPNSSLQAGQIIYVPFIPATPTPAATATLPPTATPIPQPLVITAINLVNAEADPSRPNGAIAYIFVGVSGGVAPYTLYDEEIPQAFNPMPIKTDCGATVLHTVRVLSADGQTVSQQYALGPVVCP